MTIYYLGPTARVTDHAFESLWPIQRSFALIDLRCAHTLQDSAIDRVIASTQARVCSGSVFSLSTSVAATGWPVFDLPVITAIGVVATLLAASAIAAAQRARGRPLEVRAVYRGELVCLYTTTDRRTFGQVRRALLRALEWQDDER